MNRQNRSAWDVGDRAYLLVLFPVIEGKAVVSCVSWSLPVGEKRMPCIQGFQVWGGLLIPFPIALCSLSLSNTSAFSHKSLYLISNQKSHFWSPQSSWSSQFTQADPPVWKLFIPPSPPSPSGCPACLSLLLFLAGLPLLWKFSEVSLSSDTYTLLTGSLQYFPGLPDPLPQALPITLKAAPNPDIC